MSLTTTGLRSLLLVPLPRIKRINETKRIIQYETKLINRFVVSDPCITTSNVGAPLELNSLLMNNKVMSNEFRTKLIDVGAPLNDE